MERDRKWLLYFAKLVLPVSGVTHNYQWDSCGCFPAHYPDTQTDHTYSWQSWYPSSAEQAYRRTILGTKGYNKISHILDCLGFFSRVPHSAVWFSPCWVYPSPRIYNTQRARCKHMHICINPYHHLCSWQTYKLKQAHLHTNTHLASLLHIQTQTHTHIMHTNNGVSGHECECGH